ncbi:MAG: MFS transporter, partial [Oscillospiraceae bacterium]
MKNVVLLGLVSFFSDISSDMVYPLIPLYLTAAFGATPALVGVIEGIAESVASLLKVFSGYISDRYQRKKPLAFVGYATGLVYKISLVVAGSWMGILAARVVDRIGKGIRTAPRDVLVSESAAEGGAGKSFGIHKALDMAGSAVGILMAFFIVRSSAGNMDYKKLFVISAIPAIIGLVLLLFVKENTGGHKLAEREPFWRNIKGLDFNLKLYLAVTFIFTLGNSSNTFLLLKAKNIGFTDANVVFLYFLYNITASLLAIPFGKLSDKIGRKRVLVGGYFAFALVYFGFAFVTKPSSMIVIFIV